MNSKFFKELSRSHEAADVVGTKVFNGKKEGKTAGILVLTHGSEQKNVEAVERVIPDLRCLTRGSVILVGMNLSAAEQDRRFIDEDMNRLFTDVGLQRNTLEAQRARSVLPALNLMDMAVDLHSVPFTPDYPAFSVIQGGTYEQRTLADQFDVRYHVQLPSNMDGTGSTADYFTSCGVPAIGIESGYEPEIDIEDAANNIRRFLVHAGVLDVQLPPLQNKATRMRLSHALKMLDPSRFRYHPDFLQKGFRHVKAGELVATEGELEHRIPKDGLLLFSKPQEFYTTGRTPISEPFVHFAEAE